MVKDKGIDSEWEDDFVDEDYDYYEDDFEDIDDFDENDLDEEE